MCSFNRLTENTHKGALDLNGVLNFDTKAYATREDGRCCYCNTKVPEGSMIRQICWISNRDVRWSKIHPKCLDEVLVKLIDLADKRKAEYKKLRLETKYEGC